MESNKATEDYRMCQHITFFTKAIKFYFPSITIELGVADKAISAHSDNVEPVVSCSQCQCYYTLEQK